MNLLDLPIGILPGSRLDSPSTPQHGRGRDQAAAGAAQPMTGRQLAMHVGQQLDELVRLIGGLLNLQQADRSNFLGDGSRTGGGTVGLTPIGIMRANPNRRGLSVQNLGSSGNLTVGLGQTAPIADTGLVLLPGASWDGRISGAVWPGRVHIVADAASVTYSWLDI